MKVTVNNWLIKNYHITIHWNGYDVSDYTKVVASWGLSIDEFLCSFR